MVLFMDNRWVVLLVVSHSDLADKQTIIESEIGESKTDNERLGERETE